MLQLRNITKTYRTGKNKVVALDNISLDFPEKGLVFIVGKSGSGKSTLLNILGGLDKMDCGEIIIDGKSTNDFSDSDFNAYRNYHVGFIFQEFNLIDDISVRENIAVALKIQSKGHDLTTIDDALKLVNLEGLGYRSPRELSGGQKQRIAVARALVKNPQIILADEPTGALDSKTGYELMSSFKTLSENKLVIIVTHDDEFANIFGDEIVRLTDGHIIDHLVISNEYEQPKVEKITDNIIKIPSGNKIENKEIIDEVISKDNTNYVCLTSNPELLTLAYPEAYNKIFKKEDLSKKFTSKQGKLEKINKKESKKHEKARVSWFECLKMALKQYSKHKRRILFLLLFTILSISILGFSFTLSNVNNSKIIANTLSNNDIELGVMQKEDDHGVVSLSGDDVISLQNQFNDIDFAIGKEIDIKYSAVNLQANSSFAMGSFKGVVECEDLAKLNLDIIAGNPEGFNAKSLENNEIIISDYAAFELRRTGYLGFNKEGVYGVISPINDEELVGTQVLINETPYKIIGVFNTNYEDFLPLLVSEGYTANSHGLKASLNALKTYYYARVFGPIGFYEKFVEDNKTSDRDFIFKLQANDIPLYGYKNGELTAGKTDKTLSSDDMTTFYSLASVSDKFDYEVVWGELPEKLSTNQVVLSYDWLAKSGHGFREVAQIDRAIASIEKNLTLTKTDSEGTKDLLKDPIEIVAVIDIDDNSVIDPNALKQVYYKDYPIYFSESLANRLVLGIYDYDQVFFTLKGNELSYANTINKMVDEGYVVLNIDGQETLSAQDIKTYKTIALVISIVMFIFAFLIMINFVSSNVKAREKEIGILRATGARRRDILKIFAVEEGIIAIVVALISLFIVGYACSLINIYIGNEALGIQIVVFDYLTVLVTLLISIVFFASTTLLPLISIMKLKPIDAIRKI